MLFRSFKKVFTLLCLSRDKIKGQSGKNATLTPTKTLPKINFQIALSTYKLNCQNKNYIYKIKTQSFFFLKKASSHAQSACDEASTII